MGLWVSWGQARNRVSQTYSDDSPEAERSLGSVQQNASQVSPSDRTVNHCFLGWGKPRCFDKYNQMNGTDQKSPFSSPENAVTATPYCIKPKNFRISVMRWVVSCCSFRERGTCLPQGPGLGRRWCQVRTLCVQEVTGQEATSHALGPEVISLLTLQARMLPSDSNKRL